ncbi:MAG: protein kinase [Anaerolineae bacterium]|nr:protein kinase [Anaerolineae bacterium]
MDLTNTTLGPYHLVERIGQGGMATVYKARQARLDRWVAVKVLDPLMAQDEQSLARFQQEARALARLRHPNILTVFDFGEERGLAYLVTEYIAEGSLVKRLEQPMDWPKAVGIAISVARALAYAHAQGIIHRDVKPANILMPCPDWPLLGDFGLVKLAHATRQLTLPGTSVIGTPAYSSPEQAQDLTIDHRTDIYSLGVVLFEMVTGRRPFEAVNPVEVLIHHVRTPPPPPRTLNPDIPHVLDALILRTLTKSPDDRPQNMTEFIAGLQEVQTSTTTRDAVKPDSAATPSLPPSVRLGPCPHCGATINLLRAYCSCCGAPVVSSTPSLEGEGLSSTAPSAYPQGYLIVGETNIPLPSKEEIIVGRADPPNNIFPDLDLLPYGGDRAGISRHHARLTWAAGQWFITDLGSTNGTFVNKQQLVRGEKVPLHDGDWIWLGRMELKFNYGPPP